MTAARPCGLVVEDLRKRYGRRQILDGVSFTARAGRITGLLGPNGAGKSTTLRVALGLDHGSGTVTYDGQRLQDIPVPATRVGAVLDGSSFHPGRSARDHLLCIAVACGVEDRRVDEVLEYVGLSDAARRKPKIFSLGMRQRLALASALLPDPDFLVLDEPANGLDPSGVAWLRLALEGVAHRGGTVLVSSHLLNEMAVLADDVVVMAHGRVIEQGVLQDVVDRLGPSEVRVQVDRDDVGVLARCLTSRGWVVLPGGDGELLVSGATAKEVGAAAHSGGVALAQLVTSTASLENVFLALTGTDPAADSAVPPARGAEAPALLR